MQSTAFRLPIELIQMHLLEWFATQARDLPWRRTRDPYYILISEMMLQQTQVDRVIPKYEAFLAQFPTIQQLADAPTADVIGAWAGLGYNRRAVFLQRAARAVCEQYAGVIPQTVPDLLKLPGIGAYTAGAIACFAYEQDVAFLDTNIRRAIRRLFFRPEQEPAEQQLIALAQQVLPVGQGWAWNQAIMELGALICTATRPVCWRCPLQEYCTDYLARREQDSNIFVYQPAKPAGQKRVAERREEPFIGSMRYYRGRAVAALRVNATGLMLEQLGPLVKDDYSSADQDWLMTLVSGLIRDGLASSDGSLIRLPV